MEAEKKDLALFGDGEGNHLSDHQLSMIDALYENVSSLRNDLVAAVPEDANFCDHETCRRYLVARSWDMDAAQKQLESTLIWRKEELYPLQGKKFHESPATKNDPFALSLRTIGCDKEGRPIMYTCYAEAHDRWDVEACMTHLTLLLEACCELLRKRRSKGLNRSATSRQWILVVDFDGFGWRDQNPKASLQTARLMQHYPEMLYSGILVNSPYLFLGVYKVFTPLLDDRVKSKILFLSLSVKKGKKNDSLVELENRCGSEFVKWISHEIGDSRSKRKSKDRKKYWENVIIVSDDDTSETPESIEEEKHDSRGLESYVGTYMYIKTPGDAYKEKMNM